MYAFDYVITLSVYFYILSKHNAFKRGDFEKKNVFKIF